MKLFILAFVAISIQTVFAAPSRILSVKYSEEFKGDVIFFADWSKKSGDQNTLKHVAKGEKSKESFQRDVLVCESGVISLGKDCLGADSLSIYKPSEYFAEINERGENKIFVSSADFEITHYMSLERLLYMLVNRDLFVGSLRGHLSKSGIELKETDSLLQYSDKSLTYSIILKSGRIVSADASYNMSGNSFLKASFSYGKKDSLFPLQMRIEMFSNGKIQSEMNFEVSFKKEIASECGAFDMRDLGMFKFVDMRLSPYKSYCYAGCIPSVDEMEKLPDSELPKSAEGQSARNAKSAYFDRVVEIFRAAN